MDLSFLKVYLYFTHDGKASWTPMCTSDNSKVRNWQDIKYYCISNSINCIYLLAKQFHEKKNLTNYTSPPLLDCIQTILALKLGIKFFTNSHISLYQKSHIYRLYHTKLVCFTHTGGSAILHMYLCHRHHHQTKGKPLLRLIKPHLGWDGRVYTQSTFNGAH